MERSKQRAYDYALVIVLGIIIVTGLVILYSTSAYNGKLKFGKGKTVDVFFKAKSIDNILLYYKENEELKPMSCSEDGTEFVKHEPDGKKYFTSRSIYCEVE